MPDMRVGLVLLLFPFLVFSAIPARGGTAKMPARLKVKLLSGASSASSGGGFSSNQTRVAPARQGQAPKAFSPLPRIPGASGQGNLYGRKGAAGYLILGGASAAAVALAAAGFILWRKKQVEEEEEW